MANKPQNLKQKAKLIDTRGFSRATVSESLAINERPSLSSTHIDIPEVYQKSLPRAEVSHARSIAQQSGMILKRKKIMAIFSQSSMVPNFVSYNFSLSVVLFVLKNLKMIHVKKKLS